MKKYLTKKERAYKKYKALGKKVDDLRASGVERAWLSPEGEECHEHYSHCCRVGVFFFPDYRHSIGYKCMMGKVASSIAKKERQAIHMAEAARPSFDKEVEAYKEAQQILLTSARALKDEVARALVLMEKADGLRVAKGWRFANQLDADMEDLQDIVEKLEDITSGMINEDLSI